MKSRFHYAWAVAAVTFLVLLAAAGVRSTPSLLMVPLGFEFGWSRALVSSAVAVNILLFGLIGPFAARLMDRIGLRRATCLALLLVSAGVLLSTRMSHPWQLIATWGILVGTGTGGASMVLAAVVANRWFHLRRGLVTGALSAANATGQLVFLPLMARVIEHNGWRSATLIIGLTTALIALIAWLVMRDSPDSMGIQPYGSTSVIVNITPPLAPMPALAFAIHKPEFWLLAGTFFVCGLSTNGLVGTHLIPACHDAGIGEVRAAGLLAMMGVFDILGTTASGWFTDRTSPRLLLGIYYGLRGLSLLALPAMLAHGDTPQLNWFAVFYGLDWIATVPPTVRLTSDAFGRENTGVIYGWIAAAHQIGASLAAFAAGAIRTTLGDYRLAFYAASVMCMLAAAAFAISASTASSVPQNELGSDKRGPTPFPPSQHTGNPSQHTGNPSQHTGNPSQHTGNNVRR